MGKAIQSVEGAKIVTAPARGTGENGETIAVVQLSGKATLGKVTTAIENAKTPHADKVPPAVTGATTLKLKQGVTRAAVVEALKKAGLLEEE